MRSSPILMLPGRPWPTMFTFTLPPLACQPRPVWPSNAAELRALREVAAVWMERLQAFRPHLTGAVWRGTATRLNSIHLQLFCDDAKEAEIELLNRRIDFDVGSLNGPRNQPIDVLSFSTACAELGEPVTLHLSILDFDDLRGALKADTRGRTERGDLAALRRLLDAEAA